MNSNFYPNEYSYNDSTNYPDPNFFTVEVNSFKYSTVDSFDYESNASYCEHDFNSSKRIKSDDSKKKIIDLTSRLTKLKEENNFKINESSDYVKIEIEQINQSKIKNCLSIVNDYKLSTLYQVSSEIGMDFKSLEVHINNLVLSCTKDNICSAKNWIIEQTTKEVKSIDTILDYMLFRISTSTAFNEKLHILYLLNDLLHYCKRKQSDTILLSIERVVVCMYMYCSKELQDDNQVKLDKVLLLWETNNYINSNLLSEIKFHSKDSNKYIDKLHMNDIEYFKTKEDSDHLFKENRSISLCLSDAKMKINNLESNHEQLRTKLKLQEENLEVELYQLERNMKFLESKFTNKEHLFEPQFLKDNINFQMPDVTQPPPGFLPNIISQRDILNEDVITSSEFDEENNQENVSKKLPYWKLPTAVMVVQIKLGDFEYIPINAETIELPDLKKPSKQLLDSVNQFYSQGNLEHPKDNEGWEKSGLIDFYKLKEKARNKEISNDFIRSLHIKKHEENLYLEDRLNGENTHCEILRNNYSNHTLMHPLPERSSSRSLLGNPWDNIGESSRPGYNIRKSIPVSNRGFIPKVTPLMSIDLPHTFKNKEHRLSRLDNTEFYRARNRSFSRSYSRSDTRSDYSRSRSKSNSSKSRSSSKSSYDSDNKSYTEKSSPRSRSGLIQF